MWFNPVLNWKNDQNCKLGLFDGHDRIKAGYDIKLDRDRIW